MPVTYDLQKNDVAGAFRISKVFLKMLNESTHRTELLPSLQALYNVDENMSVEDFEFITNNRISCYKLADICRNFDLTIHQACQYLERVRIAQCVNPNTATSEWADYLKASKLIGCDLSDRRVKYPAALRTEHDKVMYKKKIIENENYEENFKKITEEYGEKYSYKTKNFIVTYPKKLEDLFEEVRELNHCVGSYGDSIRDGSSVILFIRKADEPDKPYYTMEVNPLHNAVTQLHGYSNKNINKSKNVKLHEFIKEWANRNKIIYQ
jgi:hypothetical protein